jgi:type IV pilus assembly protein PilQ
MTRVAIAVGLAIALGAGGAGVAEPASGRDACARGTRWRGHRIDLDLKDASLPDVFRFLADVGRVNIVVSDDVAGKVTMRLRRVPWDQVLCTVAATKQLEVSVDGTVYLIVPRGKAR